MEKLLSRADRLSFMDVGDGVPDYQRMTKFTALTGGKNPKEYSRQYVDMRTEVTDTIGYATGVEYSLDRHSGNPVHDAICEVTDDELVGTDAQKDIVTVDKFTADGQGRAIARKRTYAIVPDTEGDGTDALIYSGTFKAVSEIEKGYATTTDDWQTITYTKGDIPS